MKKLIPTMYTKSIYNIDYKILKNKNIKCLLFDLDNTCIPYPEKKPTNQLKELFIKLEKMGFRIIIFSNTTPNRLEKFKNLNVEIVSLAKKPSTKNFIKTQIKYKLKNKEVCIIGDQLFTDIYGGNKAGIYTMLTDPLGPKDLIFTKITRQLEKLVFKIFSQKNILKKGVYYYER